MNNFPFHVTGKAISIDIFLITKGLISSFFVLQISAALIPLGCFKDAQHRAIPTLEGQSSILDGYHESRSDPITKCKKAACALGYKCFALQVGGWCASSASACSTYGRYGPSTDCQADGEGGGWANNVYRIAGNNL